MTRDEAESIQLHLIEAAAAIGRAEHAIAEAGPDAREALGGHLRAVGKSLHTGLLYTIYQRFPDLKPQPEEEFAIDSELYWDEVLLPAGITALAYDDRIDHQGDLRIWRFSEARLLPQAASVP
jgi:hypothetical protein